MEGAIEGVKVIDLTWYITGPYCTKLLADYGADVIKIERPGFGDPARRFPPFLKDDPHPEKSGLFLHLNTNKKGITLNLKTQEGRSIFLRLIEDADLVVENFSPGVMSRLGLDYSSLEKINPRLVMLSISNFGQTGPYRDFKASELVLNAFGTAMKSCGNLEREPLKMGGRVVQYQAGALAAVAAMTAIIGREIHGTGQHIDFSITEALLGSIDRRGPLLVASQYTGETEPRLVPGGSQWGACPDGVYPCKDGYFDVVGGPLWWPRLYEMLGKPNELSDPRYGSAEWQSDPVHQAEILSFFYPWAMERTREEIMEEATRAEQVCGALYTPADLLKNPHFLEREYFKEIDHPIVKKLKYSGPPCWPEGSPCKKPKPAPLLGQHNEEIYGKLGYTRDDIILLRASGVI
jgi:crotonobetainyl-CoA:carnitine CoA-transferase CaiB-like acyl-CoA transferase